MGLIDVQQPAEQREPAPSLPRDVQDQIIRRIAGLEKAEIMRYGYAVEYDFATPTQLDRSLQTRLVSGLYFAGQLNGTTGYEEAAGQGLLAGANAALGLAKREPLVLDRSQAYLGVLVDDLVTRGVDEPYRMFTSRAEYRLLLRHDNADRRLTPLADRLGLVGSERREQLRCHEAEIERGLEYLQQSRHKGRSLEELLRRPEVDWQGLCEISPGLAELKISPRAARQLQIEIKYAGYIRRQAAAIRQQDRIDGVRIASTFDFDAVPQLRNEAREKLLRVRPDNLGQASRISGITPADLAVLMLYLQQPPVAETT